MGTANVTLYARWTNSTAPTVTSTNLNTSYTGTGPGNFTVTFSKDVNDPIGNTGKDDVTNPANYLLVNKGTNGSTDTLSCSGGVAPDDIQITVTSVSYNNTSFTSTVTLAGALPVGSYRLFVCGTTSIIDLVGNPPHGGSDYTFDFVVQASTQSTSGATPASLPKTGFPQNEVTILPFQPVEKVYASTDMWLEIPTLNVRTSIVGVPASASGLFTKFCNELD